MAFQKYRALLHAVEHGSISRAAEQMGYTQSAVSRMISDLEQEWGMALLHRGRGGIELTAEGHQLLPHLRTILSEQEELDYALRELHGLHTGLIRVGTFTTVSDKWIPALLLSFRRQYPNISFKLVNSESYSEIEDWIRRGKVDCGFVRLPTENDLDARFLKRDMLAAILPPDHPLADRASVTGEDLRSDPFILLTNDEEIRRFSRCITTAPAYEVSTDHTILTMVEQGVGISVMHSLIADTLRYRVVWKPFAQTRYRDIAIAAPPRASAVTRLFMEHVCQSVAP